MFTTYCQNCKGKFGLNEIYKIGDTFYCQQCAEQYLSENVPDETTKVEQQIDPTICFNCGHDNGSTELETIVGLPVCNECKEYFYHRPFPGWIKAALTVVLALVIFTFAYNFRFMKSYHQMKTAMIAIKKEDFEKSTRLMKSASSLVPEDTFLKLASYYFQGIYELSEGNWQEALDNFNKSKELSPDYYDVGTFILTAKIGIAFDNKDYDSFVKYALEFHSKHDNSYSNAQAASAYACKYAVTGDEQYKNESLAYLAKAKKMSGNDEEFCEYEQRILHRLHTMEVITREEFNQRFPNGWQEPQKE